MDIRDWAAQNDVAIRIERASTTILRPDGSEELSQEFSVCLLAPIAQGGECQHSVVERSGDTLAEAMAGLCMALDGGSARIGNTWVKMPKLECIR